MHSRGKQWAIGIAATAIVVVCVAISIPADASPTRSYVGGIVAGIFALSALTSFAHVVPPIGKRIFGAVVCVFCIVMAAKRLVALFSAGYSINIHTLIILLVFGLGAGFYALTGKFPTGSELHKIFGHTDSTE